MERVYKGHIIRKVSKGNIRTNGYHIEYYTIDGKDMFLFLRDAKAYIDKMERGNKDVY